MNKFFVDEITIRPESIRARTEIDDNKRLFFGLLTSGSPVAPRLLASPLFWSYGMVMVYVTQRTTKKTPTLPDPTLPLSRDEASPVKAAWVPGN